MEKPMRVIARQQLTRVFGVAALAMMIFGAAGCARSPEAKEAKFLERGKQFLKSEAYSRALLEFRNAIQVKPGDAEPYYQLGLAYQGLGETGAAAASFRKAIQVN